MNTADQIALVTGANRGIGRQFVLELLDRGASKVYATARRPESLDFTDSRVVPLRLDLLDHDSVVAAAKAAEWNMTNGVRLELAAQGTLVRGVLLGAADTDLMAGYDGPKIDPHDVPRLSLDGLAAGSIEVIVDDWTAMVKASLAGDPAPFYTQITELLGAS